MSKAKSNRSPNHNSRSNPTRSGGRSRSRADAALDDEQWRVTVQQFYRRRRRQKIAGWVLVASAAVVAVNHFLLHVNALDVLVFLSQGWQDLLAGYPIAAVMALAGVVLLGQLDDPPRRPTR